MQECKARVRFNALTQQVEALKRRIDLAQKGGLDVSMLEEDLRLLVSQRDNQLDIANEFEKDAAQHVTKLVQSVVTTFRYNKADHAAAK